MPLGFIYVIIYVYIYIYKERERERNSHLLVTTHLDEAICMRGKDGDVSRLRIWVVLGDVLLHCQLQYFLLRMRRCSWIFSYVLAIDNMLVYIEEG